MNCVEISSIFCRILGPLVLGWAPNHFILGTQLAPGEKMLVCIPVKQYNEGLTFFQMEPVFPFYMITFDYNRSSIETSCPIIFDDRL